jgi:hypothetical protein
MTGAMVAMELPDAHGEDPGGIDSPLTGELMATGFEAPVMIWPRWPRQVLRVSAHHYNTVDEYEALARVLVDKLASRRQPQVPRPTYGPYPLRFEP